MQYPYYGNGYYPSPAPQMPIQNPMQRQTAPEGILWTQGEEAAKAYLVAAGRTVVLMDTEKPTFYVKSVDQSGMPFPLRIFDYTERNAPVSPTFAAGETNAQGMEFVTRKEFDALAAKINALASKEGENNE